MALLYGIIALQQNAAANKPHAFGFNTPRSVADDTLVEVWNGSTNAARVAVVDKDGKFYSAAATVGDLLYAVAGAVTGVQRLDSLAIGASGAILTSDGAVPVWSTGFAADLTFRFDPTARRYAARVAGTGVDVGVRGERARNTLASPAVVQQFDLLASFEGAGWDTSGYLVGGHLRITAQETWTAAAHGTRLEFFTTAIGASAQALRWTVEDSGILMPGANNSYDIGTASFQPRDVYVGRRVLLADGLQSDPPLRFSSNPTTGVFLVGANSIGLTAAGVARLYADTVEVGMALPVRRTTFGSAATPDYSATGDPATGFFIAAANQLGLATGGVQRLGITATQITLALAVAGFRFKGADHGAISGTQNNYAIGDADFISFDQAGATATITGIAGGVDGREVTFTHRGTTGSVSFTNEDGGSTAANRLRVGATRQIDGGFFTITFVYDGTQSRWRIKALI